MVYDSQIVRAKQTSSWASVGPANDKHQISANGLKLNVMAVLKSEAWSTVQLKRKP